MTILFCDSNSELWFEKQERMGIRYIAMPYTLEGKEVYYDLGKATDFHAFFDKMRGGARVTTSALNKQDYVDYFEPIFAEGDDIFYVTFSHKMSATFEQMDAAVKELLAQYPDRRFFSYDTRNISIGECMVVEYAVKLFGEGATPQEIIPQLDNFRRRVNVQFTPETLTFLARGGRLSKSKAVFGNLFNVKPIITVEEDGSLNNYTTVNGRKKALKYLADKTGEHGGIDTTYPLIIDDADIPVDGDFLAELIHERCPDVKIERQPVGPVIGCHCGPGTIGMTWVSKENQY